MNDAIKKYSLSDFTSINARVHESATINIFRNSLIYFGFYEMAPLVSEICIRLVVTFDDFPDVGMTHEPLEQFDVY